MIELINNCTHGSEHATYIGTNGYGQKKIIKAATSGNGIRNLRREIWGMSWYQGIRYPGVTEPICRVTQERRNYLQIQAMYIKGDKPVSRNGLERNAGVIRRIVRHYCDVWPYSSDLVPLHGDLDLGNIIINSDGVHIVDWEYFAPNAVPWGFDAIFLLFEALFFGMRFRFKPTSGEVRIIREQLDAINMRHTLSNDMIRTPLRSIREFMTNNGHYWDGYLTKFPVLLFPSDQAAMIDKMIYPASRVTFWRKTCK